MKSTEFLTTDSDISGAQQKPLREYVKRALENYFSHLDGHTPSNLYELVLEEIEIPLLEIVMRHVKNNQCKAAILMGISRGTLRKKLKQYSLEKQKNAGSAV